MLHSVWGGDEGGRPGTPQLEHFGDLSELGGSGPEKMGKSPEGGGGMGEPETSVSGCAWGGPAW